MPKAIITLATLLVALAGGLVTVLGAASRRGVMPDPIDLLIGAALGLAFGVVASPLGVWVGARRRLSRVLPMLLFLPLGVCVWLGPFGNAPLTITGALCAYALGVVAIAFFIPVRTQGTDQRCPVCAHPVGADHERCPSCAVQLRDVSAGSSSSLPASSSTRSA